MKKPTMQAIDYLALGIAAMACACTVYLVRNGIYSDTRRASKAAEGQVGPSTAPQNHDAADRSLA